ncbi:MAG: DUF4097 family beta strand repeat-containing protein [Jatrophihabitantaceae bacterium]
MSTQTFPVNGPIDLQARLCRGSLTIDAQDGLSEASVQLTARHSDSDILDRVVVELRGRTLVVTAPREGGVFDLPFFGNRSRDAVDVVVRVPTGTPVKASTFSADVIIRGEVGGADIAAGAADIGAEHIAGDLRLRYGSGKCKIVQVDGSVEARSGSGKAQFGRIEGSLSAGCGSGELLVRSVGGRVRSRAGSGTFTLNAVHGDVDLASGSGPMNIGLPAGRPARLDLHTGSGRVNSELPIDDVPMSKGEPISVRARTGSGDIHLFRAS